MLTTTFLFGCGRGGPTAEFTRRRDAQDYLAGKARPISPNGGRPDMTDGNVPHQETRRRREET